MHPKLTGYWIQGKTDTVLPPHTVLNIQQNSVAFDKVPYRKRMVEKNGSERKLSRYSEVNRKLAIRQNAAGERFEYGPVDFGVPQVVFRIRI